jgi:hypothetical protein
MAATILSRPILVAGAFPESQVAAMCLPHKITGATTGSPEESNLIVLVGAKIDAEFGEISAIPLPAWTKQQTERWQTGAPL